MSEAIKRGLAEGRLIEVKMGNAVLGYRENKPPRKYRLRGFADVKARQRRNDLRRLVSYRRQHGLAIGGFMEWAVVLADTVAALGETVTVEAIERLAHEICLPRLWSSGVERRMVAETAVAFERGRRLRGQSHRPCAAVLAGEYLGLTSVERADCGIRTIDAEDQSKVERVREMDKLRKARERRNAGAVPRAHSIAARKPWEELGISRATYFRKGMNRS